MTLRVFLPQAIIPIATVGPSKLFCTSGNERGGKTTFYNLPVSSTGFRAGGHGVYAENGYAHHYRYSLRGRFTRAAIYIAQGTWTYVDTILLRGRRVAICRGPKG